ncbi:MAG: KpsF/GutQ family sugar-phosphate isomerase [Holosporales bacterium]|jgi:arabinose-5-phosphate isomerase|nr:KpsF/GutQ family sugar-phosphate isomerase [Holosporales bacterium]
MNFLLEARRVIEEEAKALELLASKLPNQFEDAVNLIFESTGKLAVCGIGKSGHICRKISSTMASLGQKSFFLHPSEAHHGDLGMLDQHDVLLLISYSGESVELFPVIDFAKRLGIKVISISKSDESTIAKNSNIHLCLPNFKEACPLGVAPTTSSTVTLALGDALSVALLSKRGFTKAQFKDLHPGGMLGQSILFTFDIMHKNMPLLHAHENVQKAVCIASEFGFGCVGIINSEEQLIGIVTDGDLRRYSSDGFLSKIVGDIMTQNPITVHSDILASELLHIMESKKITSLFVVNEKKHPIGLVHIHDIISRKIV